MANYGQILKRTESRYSRKSNAVNEENLVTECPDLVIRADGSAVALWTTHRS